jgi:ribonucleoside-diphosphate reductase alpha chain
MADAKIPSPKLVVNAPDDVVRTVTKQYGPSLAISEEIHATKYRAEAESFREAMSRIANTLADDPQHFYKLRDILLPQRFLPGGRVQSSIGSPRRTTAFNCFVSGTIHDSMDGIMEAARDAAQTMRLGGGIGYDFSTIRPRGDKIISLDSKASGVVSFMEIFNAVCKTVSSAGNRRGAQMGVLRIDHPDIEEFIEAKTNETELTKFNISVGVTDEFMEAVVKGREFELRFNGQVYKRVDARYLRDKVMRAAWDWAEPGILFIDRINEMNNLYYCETISATNPCGEQPLPPHGACLLGSFNLVKYLNHINTKPEFDWDLFKQDIPEVVRAMDNIIDKTTYPLKEQELEAKNKRRMGLGVTALANAGEALGMSYGSRNFIKWENEILKVLTNECYKASAMVAKEKGPFPLYDQEKYLNGKFIKLLDDDTRVLIKANGIRNSHLTSIAPTGTISISADNVSSGIEPVFSHSYDRTIQTETGAVVETVTDYGFRELGVVGKTANECTIDEHLNVLVAASRWVDSAVSKTMNVGDDVSWEDFKDIYLRAWKRGCKGCTTFRASGLRYGILNETKSESGDACYINPETGAKECG